MANVYDCGKCDKQHASTAGGVVIGPDGLVLTNYHVIEKSNPGTLGLVAVTHDGVAHPIVEILAASAADDVALIRIGGDTSQLQPAPVANKQPGPMTPVNVLSHPHRQYFVLTDGQVSRYTVDMRPLRPETVWMEITADCGGGSSGSGVFNEAGEVVGLVSAILPLVRPDESGGHASGESAPPGRSGNVELNLHRCVPLNAILDRFAK
jgi:S1-C subfamily serine protease